MITSAQVMTFTDDLYGAAEKAVAAGVSAEQFAKIAGWYFECARDGDEAAMSHARAKISILTAKQSADDDIY